MSESNPTPPEPTPNPGKPEGGEKDDKLDQFKEIKEQYETKLDEKNQEIENLKKQLEEKDKKVNNTINDLKDEVNEKLRQSEEYQKLQETVQELQKDKAKATVDRLIQKGIILPVQKDTAVDLCLTNPDTFIKLYENAQPIIQVGEQKSKKVPTELAGQLTNYLK